VLELPLEAKMIKENLCVSVVIPAYNEESRIADCLDALMRQTVKPCEIIVVDNNCTDKTVVIAQKYKGVKIVKELFQGRAAAREKGFNTAKGDILARFDADTVLPSSWIERVAREFTDDPHLAGLTGYGVARVEVNVPRFLWRSVSKIWSWTYFTHCRGFFGVDILWGGNMAIRRSAWLKAKNLCMPKNNEIHEDQDVSLAIASIGGVVKIDPQLVVSVDFYETEYFEKYRRYWLMKRRGRKLHKAHARSKLRTLRKINFAKRCILLIVTVPIEVFYGALTLINSAIKVVPGFFRRSANK
jgi:glycosyltransferase involved in cell wall biosynthesis